MQYSVYLDEDRGHYDWHEDVGLHGGTSSRVLSASVQLSDGASYKGGDLSLRWGTNLDVAPRTQGTVVLFPSEVSHRVTPVTAGERHSLVLWFQMPDDEARENAARAEAAAAKRAAVARRAAGAGGKRAQPRPQGSRSAVRSQATARASGGRPTAGA